VLHGGGNGVGELEQRPLDSARGVEGAEVEWGGVLAQGERQPDGRSRVGVVLKVPSAAKMARMSASAMPSKLTQQAGHGEPSAGTGAAQYRQGSPGFSVPYEQGLSWSGWLANWQCPSRSAAQVRHRALSSSDCQCGA
jgi:hypothetical protein